MATDLIVFKLFENDDEDDGLNPVTRKPQPVTRNPHPAPRTTEPVTRNPPYIFSRTSIPNSSSPFFNTTAVALISARRALTS